MKIMKRVVLIIFLMSDIYSQDDTTKVETNQLEIKSQDLSISVLWTLFGFTHAKYSKNFDNGKKEYGFMLGTFGYDEDYNGDEEIDIIDGVSYGWKGATGGKGSYRVYRKEGARGLFAQAELSLLYYTWGFKESDSNWKDVNTFFINPAANIGYKYYLPFFDNKFFIEGLLGIGYNYTDPKDGDVKFLGLDDDDDDDTTPEVVEENGAAEFVPDLGINIGFSF
tara:strand:- start:658 stop:1326 length:669 start_codon:yes stop_codon:yes gene_type:complete